MMPLFDLLEFLENPVVLIACVLVLVVMLTRTANTHRRHTLATDLRLCRGCGTSHPPIASFCRNCGRKL